MTHRSQQVLSDGVTGMPTQPHKDTHIVTTCKNKQHYFPGHTSHVRWPVPQTGHVAFVSNGGLQQSTAASSCI